MKKNLFKTRLLSFAAFCGLALAFASCANEDVAQGTTGTETDNDKNLTTFVAGDEAKTRTSMDYTSGNFYWEAGDKIYVKDDDGTWQVSSNAPTSKVASFQFKVPGKFNNSTTYKVYYPGKNGNRDKVTIPATQSQSEPNTTTHFGASGDCGMADASKQSNGSFAFTLDHKAAYLLLLPRTSNTILHDCYLTKVEVNSDNDITSTYTLDPTTGELTGTGTGKQIVLTTKGSGTFAYGFPLTNNATSAATNGSYVVIKPGTHTLKIRYWVRDFATSTEGTITKTLASATYDQNKYYNITADLNVKNYEGDKYYMWDAQQNYWSGHEWNSASPWQPVLNGGGNYNYPNSTSDPRYCNTYFPGTNISNPATHAPCKDLPNANEMAWYAQKGDPHWDDDELWTTMGHLHKGGMWFLKQANITGFRADQAPDGRDWRTNNGYYSGTSSLTLPSAADASKYFYLPASGWYYEGQLYLVGTLAFYWSSSAYPGSSNYAYDLHFNRGYVYVRTSDERRFGSRVGDFE